VETITAKQLHQQTKSVLDQLERGAEVLVTRNGRPVAKLEPVSPAKSLGWVEVMKDVWDAQSKIRGRDRVANPILAERARRRR
jgi:prevent-host-death family protein